MNRVDAEWDISEDMKQLYGSLMSAKQLAKLDLQPNPFNFSERVSQTARIPCKVRMMHSSKYN